MGSAATSKTGGAVLAELRQDVRLFEGPRGRDGAPSYVLHDPAADGYFHIGPVEVEMLARWVSSTPDEIAAAVGRETSFTASTKDVESFAQQLRLGGLLRLSAADVVALVAQRKAQQPHFSNRLVSELLFKRFPLLRPQRFLDATAALAAPLFSRLFWAVLCAGFLASLYLIMRQWEVFATSMSAMIGLNGAVAISAALVMSKSLHELAHGYAARRFGVDVPVMGVMFILFWPLLYTETSGAWTVASRRKRVVIAAAGVAVEIALAAAALIAWPFLEPGALRDAAGFAGTTLIFLSLAFNANPLMRFDGYFVLGEAVGMANLQPRALELLRWQLRRIVAGQRAPDPEAGLARRQRKWLLVYGIASALYRVVLFTGITFALTQLLFPALAFPLAAVVLMTTLLKPVVAEVAQWTRLAFASSGLRGLVRVAAMLVLLALPLFVPWRSSVQVPVVVSAGEAHDIFATEPARVMELPAAEGQSIAAGAALAKLSSRDLEFKLAIARTRVAELDRSIDRLLTRVDYHGGVKSRERELARLRSEVAGLEARLARLTVLAPASGMVTMIDPALRSGAWVRPEQALAQIVSLREGKVYGYAEERDLGDIDGGARVSLWLEGRPEIASTGKVVAIFVQALKVLDEPLLAVSSGGPVAVRKGDGAMIPELALYKVEIALDAASRAALPMQKTRGYARIETAPRNIIDRIASRLLGLWRREFG